MLSRLAVRADRGIDRGLPGVAAIRTPPLINHVAAGQVSPVHGSPRESPARVTAFCPLRREPLAFVLGHSRGPSAFELAPKMHWIKENVQCARLLFAAGARERLSVTGACQVRGSDTLDMVPRMTFARARSRETAQCPHLLCRVDWLRNIRLVPLLRLHDMTRGCACRPQKWRFDHARTLLARQGRRAG